MDIQKVPIESRSGFLADAVSSVRARILDDAEESYWMEQSLNRLLVWSSVRVTWPPGVPTGQFYAGDGDVEAATNISSFLNSKCHDKSLVYIFTTNGRYFGYEVLVEDLRAVLFEVQGSCPDFWIYSPLAFAVLQCEFDGSVTYGPVGAPEA